VQFRHDYDRARKKRILPYKINTQNLRIKTAKGECMAITDWPENERPREKLLLRGAAALSDAELLAIFLRTGIPGKSAVDMARELIGEFSSLTRLFAASRQDFCAFPGLGDAKYAQLQAVLEMARRALSEEMRHADALNSPAAVRDYLRLALGGKAHEGFLALYFWTARTGCSQSRNCFAAR
jgi:DNA replication and repair protein RadC